MVSTSKWSARRKKVVNTDLVVVRQWDMLTAVLLLILFENSKLSSPWSCVLECYDTEMILVVSTATVQTWSERSSVLMIHSTECDILRTVPE